MPSHLHHAEVALLHPFLRGTSLSIAAALTQGLLSVLQGLTLQSIHHKLFGEMPARGALEIAEQLTLYLHGALICERFLHSQGLGQQESVLLMRHHYAPVGEPPFHKMNSMESQSIRAAQSIQGCPVALCLDRHSTS